MLSVPDFVVINFPGNSGPPFPPFAKNHPTWVPIPAFTAPIKNNRRKTRTQIPIVVSRALTTYKAQGMSLEKVYAYLKDHWLTYGLDYTAISRVTDPNGLILHDFSPNLLDKIRDQEKMKAKNAHMKRLIEELQPKTNA